ncbi:hypothetical protein [Streptomyces sp. NPDC048611]|uniref:hypothetical protein n=1 Tax=Streptomyces sp. NPDC048611 TaxID=3155635 RepID=UPI0034162A1A
MTVKLSDGVREVTVEVQGDGALGEAETTAVRLYGIVTAGSSPGHRTGFANWALSSDTERSPEE